MSVRRAVALLVAAVLLLGGTAAGQMRRALVIGINQYDSVASGATAGLRDESDSVRARVTNLQGGVNDAIAMRELLVSRFGFDSAQVRILTNADATREGILGAIRELADASAAGDLMVVFYAGHGAQRRNSLSSEATKLDQTIVPADANAGVEDIRDKELARLITPVVRRGVHVTLIFDSCHSGSITRGPPSLATERWAAVDPRDVRDGAPAVAPETAGALVLSAAQDDQTAAELADELGVPHGVFTAALLRVLRGTGGDIPAADVLRSVKAAIQSDGRLQEPVIAGLPGRVRAPLFGVALPGVEPRPRVAVTRREAGDTIVLQGGLALGLRPGVELVPVDSAVPKLRLRVVEASALATSRARVIAGDPAVVTPGLLLELDRWAQPDEPELRVWVPPAPPDLAAALAEADRIRARRAPVPDPTEPPAGGTTARLVYSATGWALRSPRGTPIAPSKLRPTAPVAVFLPPSKELRASLRLGVGTPNDAVELSADPGRATYSLVGRLRGGTLEYAWARAALPRDRGASPLPVRTDWVAVGRPGEPPDSAALRSLESLALRLARIRAWHRLEGPPSSELFPYRLELRSVRTGRVLGDTSTIAGGDSVRILLRADSTKLAAILERRRVYLLAIDAAGAGYTLFPENQNDMNWVPIDPAAPRAEERLGTFEIVKPYGADTYVLLTSLDPLPLDALNWTGVRSSATERGSESPLAKLLQGVGTATRAPRPTVPLTWSIERRVVQSVPPREKR